MNDTHGERSGTRPEAIIDALFHLQARVADDIVEIDPHTWAIHGFILVDGDVLLAEFDSPESANVALEQLSAAESRIAAQVRDGAWEASVRQSGWELG
jgi:hypothetical protein